MGTDFGLEPKQRRDGVDSNQATRNSVSSRRYFARRFPTTVSPSLSRLSNRSSPDSITVDSVNDFQDDEWTPPDSAYGAACPVCGCLPKGVRRLIELCIVAGIALFVVYSVVLVSIWISREATNQAGDDDGDLNKVDDDFYLEDGGVADYYNGDFGDDDGQNGQQQGGDDDDDYFNEDADDGNNNDNDGDDDDDDGGNGQNGDGDDNGNRDDDDEITYYYDHSDDYYAGGDDDANGRRRQRRLWPDHVPVDLHDGFMNPN